MSSDTLILNRNFFAVQIAPWEKVMALLFKGHAVAVDENYNRYNFEEWKDLSQYLSDHKFVNTPNFKIAVPEVIALTFYDEMPHTDVKFTRRNLYKHYAQKCCYCGKRFPTSELNLDHVIPKSKRGLSTWENIVLSCVPCNSFKGNRTPNEAGLTMNYIPSKPEWRPTYALKFDAHSHCKISWQKFIDLSYWNTELR